MQKQILTFIYKVIAEVVFFVAPSLAGALPSIKVVDHTGARKFLNSRYTVWDVFFGVLGALVGLLAGVFLTSLLLYFILSHITVLR